MALNSAQNQQIKALIKNDGWDVMMFLLADQIDTLNRETIEGQDAFNTLKNLHLREGKVAGLTEFFERIERQDKL